MKNLLRAIGLAVLLAASAASHANPVSYDFSYTFSTGDVVSGSFDGNANGNLITILSNLVISLDGAALNGGSSFFSSSLDFSGAGIASFDGLQNNFIAVDTDLLHAQNIFLMGAFNGGDTDAAGLNTPQILLGDGNGASPYAPSRWNIAAASAVPEPGSYALLLAGALALIGVMARRRTGSLSGGLAAA